MRLLFFLLTPFLGYSQFDTTLTYHQKEIHSITRRVDSTTIKWTIDTINYATAFDIKLNKSKNTIAIDGYGTYKITKQEIHGAIDSVLGHPYYELSNGSHITWIEKWMYWEYPFINGKSKMVIFVLD